MLSPSLRREVRAKGLAAFDEREFELGMWIRNNWGLWKQSVLAQWFFRKGIYHPDYMSGIVLLSYSRRLQGLPIELEKQVKYIQAAVKKQREANAAEERRSAWARQRIRQMMMGLAVSPEAPRVVRFPELKEDSFRVRYAAPFADGVLMTAKRFSPETFRKDPDYSIRSFLLDLRTRTLHPITAGEGVTVEDSVVVNGQAFLNCVKGAQGSILQVSGSRRSRIPWPSLGATAKSPLRLGIQRVTKTQPERLLAIRGKKVARWEGGRWKVIWTGRKDFPLGVLPAELHGTRLILRDEGQGEGDKRLYWIDLHRQGDPVSFDRDVGVVGPNGPRWENVWDYAVAPDGAFWIATGSLINRQSLLRWTRQRRYRVALYNDSVDWSPDFLTYLDSREDPSELALAVSGLQSRSDGGVDAVGPHGLFTVGQRQVRRQLRFTNTPKDWIPSKLLTLSPSLTLVGGHFGGLFLLEKSPQGDTSAFGLDDRMGSARDFSPKP